MEQIPPFAPKWHFEHLFDDVDNPRRYFGGE
jgi:hypothetical protein